MIGQAMLYTVAVGVPIFLAAALGAHYLRQHGRAERWVWAVGLALAFAVPLGMVSRGPAAVELVAPAPATDGSPAVIAAPVEAEPALAAPATTPVDLDPLLLGMWLLGSGMLVARWAVSSVRLAALTRSWHSVVLDGIGVLETDGMGPAVAGLLRPRILVPSWVRALPAVERRLVLLHEHEHVRAGDHLLVGLCRLARIAAPWNPIVWMLTWRLGRALELDCDRRVLRRRPDVRAYGATLLAISERTSRRWLTAAAFAESDVPIRRRILAMTTPPRALTALGVLGTLLVGAALLMGATWVPVPEVGVKWASPRSPVGPLRMEQGADQLPVPKVISAPNRPWVLLFREGWQGQPAGARQEFAIVGPDGRWYTLSDAETRARPVVAYTRANWGVILPADPNSAAFPADQPIPLTRAPRILNSVEILDAIQQIYPPRLEEQGLGATVGIHLLVGSDGSVEDVRIGQVSAYPDLDEAALDVARSYRFSPAEVDGEPVPVWVSHAIDFRVE